MNKLRTEEEIRTYLMLANRNITEENLIADALQVEKKYEKELLDGTYEYGIHADFYNNPFILEDENEVAELKFVDQIGGIIVYKPIYIVDENDKCIYEYCDAICECSDCNCCEYYRPNYERDKELLEDLRLELSEQR